MCIALDFDALLRTHRSQKQLESANVSLRRVYELDTVIIESSRSSISVEIVQKMIEWSHWNVFLFTIESQQRVSVEFVNSDAFEECMENCGLLEDLFGVNVKPHPKYVVEDARVMIDPPQQPIIKEVASTESLVSSPSISISISMKTQRGWALVLGHPEILCRVRSSYP